MRRAIEVNRPYLVPLLGARTTKSRFFFRCAVLNCEVSNEQQAQTLRYETQLRERDGPARVDCRANGIRKASAGGPDRALRRWDEPVKICQERLASAEQKIDIIARNSAGKPFVKDFEPSQEIASVTETVDKKEKQNDEVRLF